MQFKQDDKALCTLDDQEVEVQFGPVKNSVGNPAYLVKFPNGASSLVWEEDLQPAPRFKKGDAVETASGLIGTVEAGPFTNQYGNACYVLYIERSGCMFVKEGLIALQSDPVFRAT